MRGMRGKIYPYLMAFAILISLPSYAEEDWDFSYPHKTRCSLGSMLDMNECLQMELNEVETRLGSLYMSYLRQLKSPDLLRRAQAEWARFRKLECDFSASGIPRNGSLYPYSYSACMIDFGERRIRDIQRYQQSDGVGAPLRKR